MLCWHCSHAIESVEPIPLPIQYDERLDRFTTMGQFCSFECAKGFNRDSKHYRSGERGMLLARMKRRATGKYTKTIPAPPRQVLRVFGGTMSIEEFRNMSKRRMLVSVLPKNVVPLEQIVSVQSVEKKDTRMRQIDFKGILAKSTSQNEMLRLRRPTTDPEKKDVKHGSLEQFVRKMS
jgi:ribonuclease HII